MTIPKILESFRKERWSKLLSVVGVLCIVFFGVALFMLVPQKELKPTLLKQITNSLGMTLVYILPGSFTMGSPKGELGHATNERQHSVTLTQSFYLQTTEVTQGQWRAPMGSNPSYFSKCVDDCPVEQVSWEDTKKNIAKLNQKESGREYRLPTETQWEYAVRAGSTTAFVNGGTTESECGHDPTGPAEGSYRVIRGGSWLNSARLCRAAARDWGAPGLRDGFLGFRLTLFPGQSM